jgi:hypothetical protein
VARDATARLYDVDANSIVLDKKAGTITFQAKKGRVVDLDRFHESIWATRLGDRTGMTLHRLEVNTAGAAEVNGNEVLLKVPGSDQGFVLIEDINTRNGSAKTPMERLREAANRGPVQVKVTGQIDNWSGNLTTLSKTLPAKPRRLLVKEFQIVTP